MIDLIASTTELTVNEPLTFDKLQEAYSLLNTGDRLANMMRSKNCAPEDGGFLIMESSDFDSVFPLSHRAPKYVVPSQYLPQGEVVLLKNPMAFTDRCTLTTELEQLKGE